MEFPERRVRRRGFFFSNGTEHDPGEHENAEGIGARVRIARHTASRSRSGFQARGSAGRAVLPATSGKTRPVPFKSAIATGSRRLSR